MFKKQPSAVITIKPNPPWYLMPELLALLEATDESGDVEDCARAADGCNPLAEGVFSAAF